MGVPQNGWWGVPPTSGKLHMVQYPEGIYVCFKCLKPYLFGNKLMNKNYSKWTQDFKFCFWWLIMDPDHARHVSKSLGSAIHAVFTCYKVGQVVALVQLLYRNPWRIHGAGILMLTWLGYIDGIHVTIYIYIYSSTMDPMGNDYFPK